LTVAEIERNAVNQHEAARDFSGTGGGFNGNDTSAGHFGGPSGPTSNQYQTYSNEYQRLFFYHLYHGGKVRSGKK